MQSILRNSPIIKTLVLGVIATGASFAQASRSTLIFYRDTGHVGTAIHASIKIDGEKATRKLRNDRYWTTEVAAGEHRIYGDEESSGRTYQFEGGKTYYFRVQSRYPGGFQAAIIGKKLRLVVVAVTAEIAESEMTGLKPEKP
jgi:hypothetical protein